MIEGRMPKLGIRGTATGRFRLNNVRVPKENILGPLGKGLRVALTVLDFGRTTFGACCTGAAKHCLQLAIEHANSRSEEHTSELQSQSNLVCRLLLEKKKRIAPGERVRPLVAQQVRERAVDSEERDVRCRDGLFVDAHAGLDDCASPERIPHVLHPPD